MKPDGKVKVMVKSRRVPAEVVTVSRPVYSASGLPLGTQTERLIRYDYVLDGDHQVAIHDAQRISDALGLDLEIVDASRQGFLGRLLSALGPGRGGRPTIVVSPSYGGAAGSEISQPLVSVR